MSLAVIIKILIVVFGIYLAGFFSGAETGIYRMSRFYLRVGIERKRAFFKMLGKLLDDTHGLILSMIIGTNLSQYIVTSVVTIMLAAKFENAGAAEIYSTIIMTPILFVFSELIPKNIFIYHADAIMPRLAIPLWVFQRLFTATGVLPFLKAQTKLAERITKSPPAASPAIVAVQRHHISQIAFETIEEGILTPMQSKIIHRLMSTHDVRIAEIITPIRKADAVSFDASRADLRKKFAASEHNRLLVYKNATSNIVGYIEICQLLNKARPCPDLSDLVKPILTLTSDLPVTAALNQLKNNNQRIALVVSERNKKILGLVTRKDLIEEFLGEMTTI